MYTNKITCYSTLEMLLNFWLVCLFLLDVIFNFICNILVTYLPKKCKWAHQAISQILNFFVSIWTSKMNQSLQGFADKLFLLYARYSIFVFLPVGLPWTPRPLKRNNLSPNPQRDCNFIPICLYLNARL